VKTINLDCYLSEALSGETGSSEISSLILDLDSLVGLNVEWNSSIILSSLYISLVFIVILLLDWLHIYYPNEVVFSM
jgi:hypothetical protein